MGKRLSKPDFAERLTALAKQKGGTAALAQSAGISKRTLEKWLSGETQPKADALKKIAKETGVDLNWLITGEGSPEGGSSSTDLVFVPQLPVRASAGAGAVVEQEQPAAMLAFSRRWLREHGVSPSHASVITVWGDSMEPTLRDGDLVLVDTGQNEPHREGIYVLRMGEDLLIKRLAFGLDHITIISDNPAIKDEVVPRERLDDLAIIGRVVCFLRFI